MANRNPLDSVLGRLAQRIREQLGGEARGPRVGHRAPSAPAPSTAPATIDALLPPRVGDCPRAWVNDHLGGLDGGEVFASYAVGGHEVRVTVRRAQDEEVAERMVANAPNGPVQRAWRHGTLWYFASGGTVQGDEDPVVAPGDVEALDRFLLAWHAMRRASRLSGPGMAGVAGPMIATAALLMLPGLAARPAAAVSSSQPPKEPFLVMPRPVGSGHAAFHERTAGPEGDSLVVKDLDMTRPVVIGVEPVEPGARLDVALYKMGERDAVRRGEPDADGTILFAFRTYDEVGIEVKAARPTGYRVAVIVGPPLESELPSPFVAPPPDPGLKATLQPLLWPGVSGLALLLAIAAVMRVRRRAGARAAAGMLVVALALPTTMGRLEAAPQSGPPTQRSPGVPSKRPGSQVDPEAPTQPVPTLRSPGASPKSPPGSVDPEASTEPVPTLRSPGVGPRSAPGSVDPQAPTEPAPTLRSPGGGPTSPPGSVDPQAPTEPVPTLRSPEPPAPGDALPPTLRTGSPPQSEPLIGTQQWYHETQGGRTMREWQRQLEQMRRGLDQANRDIDRYAGLLNKVVNLVGSLQRVVELSKRDLDYEPDYAPPGMPQVPSACGYLASTAAVEEMESDVRRTTRRQEAVRREKAADSQRQRLEAKRDACKACFTPAYAQLNAVRKKLENNRIVLANYTRVMNAIDDAGRGLGGMHGGLGIVYMQRKVEWDQQRQQIAGIYDQRYVALLAELQAALRKIEACEGSVNALESWYDRFGFMYYEFMAARYRRTGTYGF